MIFVSNIQEFASDYDVYSEEEFQNSFSDIYGEIIDSPAKRVTKGGIIVISDMAKTLYGGCLYQSKSNGISNVYLQPVGHAPVYQKTSDLVWEAFIKDMAEGKALYFSDYDVDYESELAREAFKKASVLIFTGVDFSEEYIKQDIEPMIDTFLAVNLDTNKAIVLTNFNSDYEDVCVETKKWFGKRFPQMETEDRDQFDKRFEEFLEDYDL